MPQFLVLTPPEFFYLPKGIAGVDLARSATLQAIQHRLSGWAKQPQRRFCLGPAERTAAIVAAGASARIAIVGGPFDTTACEGLGKALRKHGRAPDLIATIAPNEVVQAMAGLASAWQIAESGPPGSAPTSATGDTARWPQSQAPTHARNAWLHRYRICTPEDRDDLRRLTAAEFPELAAQVETTLEWAALGIDPLEEMYLGNSLIDRNAALLVNIL